MKHFFVLSFYVLALILDSVRAFYFSFIMFENENMLSLYFNIIIAFFSISPILWFTLIIGERYNFRNLKTISLVKFLSILSSMLFLVEIIKKDEVFFHSKTIGKYVFFFLFIDVMMLFFSLFRGVKLCK